MDHFLILLGDIVLNVEWSLSSLAEGSLNALPGLSLFTLVFICIFLDWRLRVFFGGGEGVGSGVLGYKFFNLSLIVFGRLEIYVTFVL